MRSYKNIDLAQDFIMYIFTTENIRSEPPIKFGEKLVFRTYRDFMDHIEGSIRYARYSLEKLYEKKTKMGNRKEDRKKDMDDDEFMDNLDDIKGKFVDKIPMLRSLHSSTVDRIFEYIIYSPVTLEHDKTCKILSDIDPVLKSHLDEASPYLKKLLMGIALNKNYKRLGRYLFLSERENKNDGKNKGKNQLYKIILMFLATYDTERNSNLVSLTDDIIDIVYDDISLPDIKEIFTIGKKYEGDEISHSMVLITDWYDDRQ